MMKTQLDSDVEALHAISGILIDQVSRYDGAAGGTKRPEAEVAIARARTARQELLVDVNARIRKLGHTPDIRGTALAAGPKAVATGGASGKKARLSMAEAERGEDTLCEELGKRAEDAELSAETRAFFRDMLVRARPVQDEIAFLKSRQ
jgi:hypothetical protein